MTDQSEEGNNCVTYPLITVVGQNTEAKFMRFGSGEILDRVRLDCIV